MCDVNKMNKKKIFYFTAVKKIQDVTHAIKNFF